MQPVQPCEVAGASPLPAGGRSAGAAPPRPTRRGGQGKGEAPRQPNAGIGATRNRCLELARGEFFIPVDADNLARPEMVERFVRALGRNPHLAAMTCYFLAFEDAPAGREPDRFLFAGRPTGGPH